MEKTFDYYFYDTLSKIISYIEIFVGIIFSLIVGIFTVNFLKIFLFIILGAFIGFCIGCTISLCLDKLYQQSFIVANSNDGSLRHFFIERDANNENK